MLHTGMSFTPTGDEFYDDCYFAIYRNIVKNVPVFPSLGNHDYETDRAAPYLANFFLPQNAYNPDHKGRCYSFDYGNAHFIALDTELDDELGLANADQRAWLERDLANSANAVWKFIYFHRPPYSSGCHGSSLDVRQVLAPLAQKYNVDVVFSGHDHAYERTAPILDDAASDAGVTYVVTGGGSAILTPIGRSAWTAFSDSFSHLTKVAIEDQTLTLQAIDQDGNLRDQYVLLKGTLAGSVVNTRGESLPDAALTVRLQGKQRAVASPGDDSNYSFYLAAGRYDVEVTSSGCTPKTERNVAVRGEQTTTVNFTLECR